MGHQPLLVRLMRELPEQVRAMRGQLALGQPELERVEQGQPGQEQLMRELPEQVRAVQELAKLGLPSLPLTLQVRDSMQLLQVPWQVQMLQLA